MQRTIKNLTRSFLCAATLCAVLPVFAADNSCEDENNMVNPALALCSTHVYNIGATENPSDGGDKEMMKEVVALKTTVMTQQMYKQYEYLESMIKRFKTQLEKAVLTTKLEAAGASSDSSSSSSSYSYKSNDRYVIIDSSRYCNNETGGTLAVYECLQGNISVVLGALENNQVSEAKRQLDSDIKIANRWGVTTPKECQSTSGLVKTRECAYALNQAITSKKEAFESERARQQFNTERK